MGRHQAIYMLTCSLMLSDMELCNFNKILYYRLESVPSDISNQKFSAWTSLGCLDTEPGYLQLKGCCEVTDALQRN